MAVGARRFLRELWRSVNDDDLTNSAAALAYSLMLAIFPFAIFLLTLLPYLPVPDLQQSIMDALARTMPPEAASLLTDTVRSVVGQRRGGLLSLGIVLTLWAMSGGMSSVITGLNSTYDVKETRPIWKTRGIALLLSVALALLLVLAFLLVVVGGLAQDRAAHLLGWSTAVRAAFRLVRWTITVGGLLLAFALIYYYGPDVEQRFRYITPGSIVGTGLLVAAISGFRVYVANFASYDTTYGSLGAVIVLMLWLYITGLVLLLGSEINAILEHHSPQGKNRGERRPKPHTARMPVPYGPERPHDSA